MKTQLLEEMAREIGSDAWKATKKVATTTAKGAMYLATAPFIGMLDEDVQVRIYSGNEKQKRAATYLSLPLNLGIYAWGLAELAPHPILRQALMPYAIQTGLIEAILRLLSEKLVLPCSKKKCIDYSFSLVGLLPSAGIRYLFKKYDNAKSKVEGEGK
jgi:hypothetical protein